MNGDDKQTKKPGEKTAMRRRRQAEQLRANLKKRKQQTRKREQTP